MTSVRTKIIVRRDAVVTTVCAFGAGLGIGMSITLTICAPALIGR